MGFSPVVAPVIRRLRDGVVQVPRTQRDATRKVIVAVGNFGQSGE